MPRNANVDLFSVFLIGVVRFLENSWHRFYP
jgi:hypothetical protein